MKKIKILFSAIIAAAILLSVCLTAFATAEPVIEIGEHTAEAGGSVTVAVSLSNNVGITYLRVTPEFNTDVLTLTHVGNGSLFPTMDEGINLVFSADSEIKTDGVLCVLTFRVSDNATLNVGTDLTLSVKECYNDRYGDVSVTSKTGRITVGCLHAYTTETVTKAPTCTEEGESLRVCNDCGYETAVSTPATGHTEGEWETVKAPAVGVTGEMAVKCAVCGETVKTQTIPALSDGGQGEPSTPPAMGGCFSAATAAVSVFFTSVLPALAVVLGKRFLF